MIRCKKIRKLLVPYSVQDIDSVERDKVKKHLNKCLPCTRVYHSIKNINEGMQVLNQESEKVAESLNWGLIHEKLVDSVYSPKRILKQGFFTKPFLSKKLVPVLGIFFIMGIITGYLLFYQSSRVMENDKSTVAASSLAKIETTLAKKEVIDYFKQSQLIITDMMKQCNINETLTWKSQDNIERIKSLLTKSRYFNQNLNNPQLLSTQIVLEKIEWLLFELLMIENDVSCEKLQRLQKFIHKERLLFKIRLIEKDLFLSEV